MIPPTTFDTLRIARRVALLAALALVPPAPAVAGETGDCIILPGAEIALGARSSGLLEFAYADRNDAVQAGEVVAALHAEQERAMLALAELRAADESAIRTAEIWLGFERELLERAEELSSRNVMSDQQLAERKANFAVRESELEEARVAQETARLELARAEAQLEIRRIRSPVTGVVVQRLLDPGEFVREDTPVFEIAVFDPLRVEIFLPQALYRDIAAGDRMTITPEAAGELSRQAVVETVDPSIDAASGTFGVRLTLPNADGAVLAGLRCRARFGPDR
jgi:RND family efflux transporter MFP subunit